MRSLKLDESKHKPTINTFSAARIGNCDFDDKENSPTQVNYDINVVKRKAIATDGTKLSRTPPRYRRNSKNSFCTNDNRLSTIDMDENMKRGDVSEKSNDDEYSFQHLKGKLINFERTQREHFVSNTPQMKHHSNKYEKASIEKMTTRRTIKASRNFTTSPKMQQFISNKTSKKLESPESPKKNDRRCGISKDSGKKYIKISNSNDDTNTADDFTFHKLRKKVKDFENQQLSVLDNKEKLSKTPNVTRKCIDERREGIAGGNRGRIKSPIITDCSGPDSVSDRNCNGEREALMLPIKKNRRVGTLQLPSAQKDIKSISSLVEKQTDERKVSVSLQRSYQIKSSTPVKRTSATSTDAVLTKHTPVKSTPRYRLKPRIKKEEVQATDDTKASVQKLAKWLSDDPFEKQKIREIKKGASVFAKSQAFEDKDCAVVLKNQANDCFRAGKVQGKKNWLETVFKSDDLVEEEIHQSVSDKKKWLEQAFKKKSTPGSAMKPHIHGNFVPISNHDSDNYFSP